MDNQPISDQTGEIKKLLEENLALTREMHEMVKVIKKHLIWQQIFGVVKLVVIIIPIIIGLIYLPPLLKEMWSAYTSLLNLNPGVNLEGVDLKGVDLKNLPELLNMFKNNIK